MGNKVLILTLVLAVFSHVSFAQNMQKDIDTKAIKKALKAALSWQEANPIFSKAPTDWTNGAYYTGVSYAHKVTGDAKFKKALIKMGKNNNWQPYERFYHADDMAICYSYLYLNDLEVKVVDLKPTETIIKQHLFDDHVWKTGEKESREILWWWCDALFMAPPVITYYSKQMPEVDYLDEMHTYYKQTYDLLFDEEEKLFFRDTRFLWKGSEKDIKEPNGNKVFWSRGNGWVLGGLALLLSDMPKDYEHRSFYENLFKTMASKIKEIQPEDGLWRVSLLHPEGFEHGEVSGSGFFTFAMAWGINNGLLDKETFTPVVLKAWKALTTCQQASGKVGWVQNIGFDPKPASVDSWQNYGTGAFLLAGSEVIQLVNAK